MVLDHSALAVWYLWAAEGCKQMKWNWDNDLTVTSDCLAIPAMLDITLRNKRGEARTEVAEIRGDDALWSMVGVLIPSSFWQLELMFKSNDKLMKALGPYQSTALLFLFSDSVASTRLCTSHLSTEHSACLLKMWLTGQWGWEGVLLEVVSDFAFMSLQVFANISLQNN